MKRLSLYERLNPDVKAKLIANQLDYQFTVGMVIAKLDSTLFWDELTVRDISNLVVFSDSDMPVPMQTTMLSRRCKPYSTTKRSNIMETKFIPTNPEELVGFDSILKEFNTINGTSYRFTDNYMENYDAYM